MATPTLTKHRFPGALGDLLVDVRSGGRDTARPAVLVVHGFKGFKDWGMFPPLADRLAQAGFTAVSVNLSGSGVDEAGEFSFPERFGRNTFSAELADLATVSDALHRGELGVSIPSAFGLVGHSRGGGMAVLRAAADDRVRALVTWAAIGRVDRWPEEERRRWRERGVNEIRNVRTGQILPLYTDVLDDVERHRDALDIEAAARRIEIPWLIVHGEADEAVAVDDARGLAAAARPGRARLLTIPGAGHTFGAAHPWRGSNADLDRVTRETVGWLARALT